MASAPQAITEKRTDVVQLASGYRASKLTGADVYNRNKDDIGTLDDLIVSKDKYGMTLTYALHRAFSDLGPAMTDEWPARLVNSVVPSKGWRPPHRKFFASAEVIDDCARTLRRP